MNAATNRNDVKLSEPEAALLAAYAAMSEQGRAYLIGMSQQFLRSFPSTQGGRQSHLRVVGGAA